MKAYSIKYAMVLVWLLLQIQQFNCTPRLPITIYEQSDTDPVMMQAIDFDPATQSDIVIAGSGRDNGLSTIVVTKLQSSTLLEQWTKMYYTPADNKNTPKSIQDVKIQTIGTQISPSQISLLFNDKNTEIYVFIIGYIDGQPLKTTYLMPAGANAILGHSGFLQRNSMASYHAYFLKTPNNLQFSRINLSVDPFTVDYLSPATYVSDSDIIIYDKSIYYDSQTTTVGLFGNINTNQKEYYVAILNAGTEFSAAAPTFIQAQSTSVAPNMNKFIPSFGYITSKSLYSCNKNAANEVSITKIDKSTFNAVTQSLTTLGLIKCVALHAISDAVQEIVHTLIQDSGQLNIYVISSLFDSVSPLQITDVFQSKKKVQDVAGILYGTQALKQWMVGYFDKGNQGPCLITPNKLSTSTALSKSWSFVINNDYSDQCASFYQPQTIFPMTSITHTLTSSLYPLTTSSYWTSPFQLLTDANYLELVSSIKNPLKVAQNQGICIDLSTSVQSSFPATINYNITAATASYVYSEFISYQSPLSTDCKLSGTYTSILYDDQNNVVSNNDFITFSVLNPGLQVKVATTSNVLKRKYQLFIIGLDSNFQRTSQKTVAVTINYLCGLSPVIFSSSVVINSKAYEYNVGDSPIYLDAKSLFTTLLPQFCPISLSLNSGLAKPVDISVVTLDINGLLKISTRENIKAGSYQFQIIAQNQPGQDQIFGIDLNIKAPYVPEPPPKPPLFAVVPPSLYNVFIELEPYVIYTKKRNTYSFKQILEDLGLKDLEFIVQLSKAGRFTTFNKDVFVFYPRFNEFIGNYTMPFRLYNTTIKKYSKQSFNFYLEVKYFEEKIVENKCPLNNTQSATKIDPCRPRIISVSNRGLVKIRFPFKLRNSSEDQYQMISKHLYLQVKLAGEGPPIQIAYWNITSFSSQEVFIQLNITNPLYVSTSSEERNDVLKLTFLDPTFFMAQLPSNFTLAENLTISQNIPLQRPTSFADSMVTQSVKLMESSLTGSLAGNIILAGVLGLAMKQIFMLINTMQILTQIPLLAILIPANVEMCLQGLSDISNLNIIPKSVTDKVLGWFGIIRSNELGKTKNKTGLMDNITYILIGIGIIFICLGILGLLIWLSKSKPKIQEFLIKIKEKFIFGVFLTAALKSYLKLAMSSVQGLQLGIQYFGTYNSTIIIQADEDFLSENNDDEDSMSKTGVVIKMILLIICSLFPFLVLIFLKRNRPQVQEETFIKKYGSLYSNYWQKGLPQLLFNVPFLLRRLIYSYSIGFIAHSPGTQLMLQILMSFWLMLYIQIHRPYEYKLDNCIEMANEGTIFLVFCLLLPYLHQPNFPAEVRYNLGFFIVAVILLNVFANFAYFAWCSGKNIFRKAKKPAVEVVQKVVQIINSKIKKAPEEPKEASKKIIEELKYKNNQLNIFYQNNDVQQDALQEQQNKYENEDNNSENIKSEKNIYYQMTSLKNHPQNNFPLMIDKKFALIKREEDKSINNQLNIFQYTLAQENIQTQKYSINRQIHHAINPYLEIEVSNVQETNQNNSFVKKQSLINLQQDFNDEKFDQFQNESMQKNMKTLEELDENDIMKRFLRGVVPFEKLREINLPK